MSDVEARLAQVYGATSKSELLNTYQQWASDYDVQMLSIGYAHHAVMAALVARHVVNLGNSILDAGVGTGAVGELLQTLGYNNLHGLDMSDAMLARAKSRGIYKGLHQGTLGEALDFPNSHFDAIISSGTFTTGHAPASAFDELTRILKPRGHLIFTVGENLWQETFGPVLKQNPKLERIWQSKPYAPMPHSKTESHFMTLALVFKRNS